MDQRRRRSQEISRDLIPPIIKTPGTPKELRRISWSNDVSKTSGSPRKEMGRLSWSIDNQNEQASLRRQSSIDLDDVFMDRPVDKDKPESCSQHFMMSRAIIPDCDASGSKRSSVDVDDDFVEAFQAYRAREKRRRSTHSISRPDHTSVDTSRTAVNIVVISTIIGVVVLAVIIISALYRRWV